MTDNLINYSKINYMSGGELEDISDPRAVRREEFLIPYQVSNH